MRRQIQARRHVRDAEITWGQDGLDGRHGNGNGEVDRTEEGMGGREIFDRAEGEPETR